VPDKRQTSKQRRAARNRASRQSLAARRDNAVAAPAPTTRSGGSAGSGKDKGRTGASAGAGAASRSTAASSEPAPKGILGLARSTRVGDKAVLFAFTWSVLVGVLMPLLYRVPVDDRGEPIPAGPSAFGGLYRAARERVTGQPVPDATSSLLDASGPTVLLLLGLPIVAAGFVLWANRRPDRARWLTYAMFAMAVAVIMSGQIGIYFFPALIAVAIAGFRVRRVDLPARTAERALGGRRARAGGTVVDADSREADDADVAPAPEDRSLRSLWARRGSTAPSGADDSADVDDGSDQDAEGPQDEVEYDPLAELEAEIEAEQSTGTTNEAPERNGPKA
jgi:hypothetical protein